MNEYTENQVQPSGRSLEVFVFGDTSQEMELEALDRVRSFFGSDIILAVVHGYQARTVLPNGHLREQANGKRYQASITVRTVEPE